MNCKCGKPFSLQHALDCAFGGYRIVQHNETRDVIAQVMQEAGCKEVAIEPRLQELTGEVFDYKSANVEAKARSDVCCLGFWSEDRKAFFDVRVFSPFAKTYSHMAPAAAFKMVEKKKIRQYGARIREVEHGDFTPLVFTCTGALAPQSSMVVKRLAEKLSVKQTLPISVVSG